MQYITLQVQLQRVRFWSRLSRRPRRAIQARRKHEPHHHHLVTALSGRQRLAVSAIRDGQPDKRPPLHHYNNFFLRAAVLVHDEVVVVDVDRAVDVVELRVAGAVALMT